MVLANSVLFSGFTLRVDEQKQNFQETASPSVEPVTLAEIKSFVRITTGVEDSIINALITSARITAEKYCNRAFIERTFELFTDFPPMAQSLEFPLSPISVITKVSSFAKDDTETVFNVSNYHTDLVGVPPRIVLKESGTWPTNTRNTNGFKVTFTAGYGDAASDVPASIKDAIKVIVAHLWELRGQIEEGQDQGTIKSGDLQGRLPLDAVLLLGPFRVEYFQ